MKVVGKFVVADVSLGVESARGVGWLHILQWQGVVVFARDELD
ncbi:hypothetical protein [Pseudomonas citri]|nr:hypothetical protein [Pseudomonas citri]